MLQMTQQEAEIVELFIMEKYSKRTVTGYPEI